MPARMPILSLTVSQLRLNPLTGRWVTIVAERAERPSDFAPRSPVIEADPGRPCPFCPGHEDATLAALDTVERDGHWKMRVLPNLYPAFDGDTGFVVHHLGPVHVTADASGVHEVFVYTPDHVGGVNQLSDEDAAELMHVVQRRLAAHAAAPEVRYTQVIVNHGREAGASLAHPHAQILGLPFVPGEILDEERAFARFAGGCVICTTIEAELAAEERVVFADDDVVCVAPFWSGAPFELLLMPRRHEAHLQDADPVSLDRHRPRHPRRRQAPQRGARRPVVQPRVPHRPARALRPVPLARAPLAEPRHGRRVRARHRRHDQRDAARDGRRHAARRPRPGVTRIHVTADYDATPDAVWHAIERVDSHVDWMADAETIRFLTDQHRGGRDPLRVRDQDRPDPPDRPHGDHGVGAGPVDGRAPHRCRHRPRPLHDRPDRRAAGGPASPGRRS